MSAAFILACSLGWATANVPVPPHLATADAAAVDSCERTFVSEQECQKAERQVHRVFDQHLPHLSAARSNRPLSAALPTADSDSA